MNLTGPDDHPFVDHEKVSAGDCEAGSSRVRECVS